MTRMREHSVGDVVAERFELLARLGAGGMGTVWRARDLLLEREVALKEMRSPATEDPGRSLHTRERVLREARALARVDDPNVVAVHEVLDQQPHPWLVMELIVGHSLHEILRNGPLTPVQAARIGLDVLGALRASHAAGILHRDVKPGNVLIRPDGSAVLTDFGIATIQGSQTLTMAGDIVGSPEYMAPERIRGDLVGPASDLWSLGMLLYVCVEGGNPVQRDSVWPTLLAVCEQPPPSPSQAGPLAPVLEALLAQEPADRPDAPRLAVLLEAVACSEANVAGSEANTIVIARPPTFVETPTLVAIPSEDPATEHPLTASEPAPRRGRRRLPIVLAGVAGAAVAATAAFALPSLGHGPAGTAPSPGSGPTSPGSGPTSPGSGPTSPGSGPASPGSGDWIAQLSEIPHTTDSDERDQELAALQQQVPGATLVDSDNWASLPSGYWIVRAPGEFASGYEALAYCAKYGPDQCSGRYLSNNRADRSYLCEAAPAPDPATCRRPDDRAASPTARNS
ncbi:protein kinase [Kitasatospora sp. NPDC048296]|uniref:serine/threonine-protein kinase n=1 Tax=Kitasatospora sp. NPDC048296 TaxID=3364048 RepID=UPI0037111F0F